MQDERKGTIKLGALTFDVGPLTLSQMRQIGMGTARMRAIGITDPIASEENWYNGVFDILSVVTGKPRAEIEKMEGVTFEELVNASNTIIRVSGLAPKKKEGDPQVKAGEANGTGSHGPMPDLQPVSDGPTTTLDA